VSDTIGSETQSTERAPRTAGFLVRLLDADAPAAGSSWHSLDGIERVTIGRGPEHAATRVDRTLALAVPDPRMSEQHAALEWRGDAWSIRDLQSKNGVRVNGAVVAALGASIDANDTFECGRSFFVLGEGASAGAPRDRHVADPDDQATFVPQLGAALAELWRVAATPLSIALVGETGSGKEVLARAVHARSQRSGAFVAINCGALPATLVEGTLFGHRRGAFSGAIDDQLGAVRAADRGTLFLDEIAELSRPAQTALLRVLQEHEVTPLGATRPVAVEFRVVVATQRQLDELVAADVLRADLVHRLAGLTFAIPPLRERRADLGLVIASLLRRLATAPIRLAPAAVRLLLEHDWPGNVRELEKCLELAIVRSRAGVIEREHLELAPPPIPPEPQLSAADRARRDELTALLAKHGGNVSAVARELTKDRVQIRRWIARYGIDLGHYR